MLNIRSCIIMFQVCDQGQMPFQLQDRYRYCTVQRTPYTVYDRYSDLFPDCHICTIHISIGCMECSVSMLDLYIPRATRCHLAWFRDQLCIRRVQKQCTNCRRYIQGDASRGILDYWQDWVYISIAGANIQHSPTRDWPLYRQRNHPPDGNQGSQRYNRAG